MTPESRGHGKLQNNKIAKEIKVQIIIIIESPKTKPT
jgi:hypothetical protein